MLPETALLMSLREGVVDLKVVLLYDLEGLFQFWPSLVVTSILLSTALMPRALGLASEEYWAIGVSDLGSQDTEMAVVLTLREWRLVRLRGSLEN